MKRITTRAGSPLMVALTLAAVTLVSVVSAEARSCRDALDLTEPRSYDCRFKSEDGTIVDGALTFEDLDGVFFSVSFELDGSQATAGFCSCKARASLQAAQFGASRAFDCVSPLGANAAETLEGIVNGNGRKIRKGQVLSIVPPPTPAGVVAQNGAPDLLRLRFDCSENRSPGP